MCTPLGGFWVAAPKAPPIDWPSRWHVRVREREAVGKRHWQCIENRTLAPVGIPILNTIQWQYMNSLPSDHEWKCAALSQHVSICSLFRPFLQQLWWNRVSEWLTLCLQCAEGCVFTGTRTVWFATFSGQKLSGVLHNSHNTTLFSTRALQIKTVCVSV